MAEAHHRSDVQPLKFIMKPTKACNLRCTYCYEFAYLDDRTRMPLADLAAFFRSIAEHAARESIMEVGFTWHGGEPFLVPLDTYRRIGELQCTLMPGLRIVNGVQTNLTILTDAHLASLKAQEFFDTLSISIDLIGDQRVDQKGRVTTPLVLDNMQRLADAGVEFSAIGVLSRSTAARAVDVFRFFDEIGTNCRFLPFYRNTDGTGSEGESLAQSEIVAALAAIFDAWMDSQNPVIVRPLHELADVAGRYLLGAPRRVYDKQRDEWTYVVNPNGDLWGISEIEDNRFLYGNVFRAPLAVALGAEIRTASFPAADARIAALCGGCPYLGHCSGYTMADVTDGVRATFEREGCHVRALLDHIVRRFEETGLAEELIADEAVADQPLSGPPTSQAGSNQRSASPS